MLLSGIVNGCATPPDVFACVEIEKDKRGYCFKTISDEEQMVDNDKKTLEGKKWSEIDSASIRVPLFAWPEIKTFILTSCKKMKSCSDNIGTWQKKTDKVDRLSKGAK